MNIIVLQSNDPSVLRLRRGVRWQAERDTAFDAVPSSETGISAGSKAVSQPPRSKTLRRFGRK